MDNNCDLRSRRARKASTVDGIQALACRAMRLNPLDGALDVFGSRRGFQLKCLYFDRSGLCIWAKRLETGKFIGDWSAVRTREMMRASPSP